MGKRKELGMDANDFSILLEPSGSADFDDLSEMSQEQFNEYHSHKPGYFCDECSERGIKCANCDYNDKYQVFEKTTVAQHDAIFSYIGIKDPVMPMDRRILNPNDPTAITHPYKRNAREQSNEMGLWEYLSPRQTMVWNAFLATANVLNYEGIATTLGVTRKTVQRDLDEIWKIVEELKKYFRTE